MFYILILLLIPVFFVGIVIFTCTLVDYAFSNNLDVIFLMIGLFGTLISSFFILKEVGLIETKNYRLLKFQKKVDVYIGLISFTLLLMFGLSLIFNSVKNTMSAPRVFIGSSIIVLYFYVIYACFIEKKEYVCVVKDILKVSDNAYLVLLYNKELDINEFYVKDKKGLKKDKLYKVKYNKTSKCVTKILNEVIEV